MTGRVKEMFGSGTAATISPVKEIVCVTNSPHPRRFWLNRGHWWGAPTPFEAGSLQPANVLSVR